MLRLLTFEVLAFILQNQGHISYRQQDIVRLLGNGTRTFEKGGHMKSRVNSYAKEKINRTGCLSSSLSLYTRIVVVSWQNTQGLDHKKVTRPTRCTALRMGVLDSKKQSGVKEIPAQKQATVV